MPTDVDTAKRLLAREFGKSGDQDFLEYLDDVVSYYSATVSSLTLPLAYKFAKLAALDYLLGNSAGLYDTQEIDITEKQGQLFDHYMKLYPIAEQQLESELGITGGSIAIGVIAKQTPVPYETVLYYNPNNSYFRGRPIPLQQAETEIP